MKLGRVIQAAVVVMAAFLSVASAKASTIQWFDNTTGVGGTEFTSFTAAGGTTSTIIDGGMELSVVEGSETATLLFVPNPSSDISNATGSNTTYGDFELACTPSPCGTNVSFGAFTIHLVVHDITDTAVGLFTGTSTGGQVSQTNSTINVSWSPAQIGPGTSGATSGSFGTDYFTYPSSGLSQVVSPSSGGDTSIQGTVNTSTVPEPATLAMAGGLLIGLAGLARKRRKA
jgi:hypothetical protein